MDSENGFGIRSILFFWFLLFQLEIQWLPHGVDCEIVRFFQPASHYFIAPAAPTVPKNNMIPHGDISGHFFEAKNKLKSQKMCILSK